MKRLSVLLRSHIFFAVMATVFGLYFSFAIPLLWGYDETRHVLRAYQISSGQLLPSELAEQNYGGNVPKNLEDFTRQVELDLQDNKGGPFYARQDVTDLSLYTRDAAVPFSKQQSAAIFNGSAVYSPAAYLPAVVTMPLANAADLTIRQTILIARISMLAAYVIIVCAALYILRDSKAKYLILIIGLLPISLSQAAVISADGMANALGLFLGAAYIRLVASGFKVSKRLYVAIAVAVCLLPLVKLNYSILLLPFLWIRPPFVMPKIDVDRRIWRLAMLGLLSLPAIIWALLTRDIVNRVAAAIPGRAAVDSHLQLLYILGHPFQNITAIFATFARYGDEYIYGLTASIGWNYVGLPLIGIVIISVLTFMAMAEAGSASLYRNKFNTVLLVTGIATLAGIFLALYLTFTPVGYKAIQGVQGRYFIPALALVLYGLARYLPFKIISQSAKRSYVYYYSGMFVVLGLSAVWYYFNTY